eukprot:CAMPEP_0198663054 /NCGR_PEP_ID=MMETSP1467-20131203/50251_1 /TAXON_ID=1462469 /ORGANISM="unid. sp., Strain CCMP2135" /LENGTH=403 /DNA_ID=CAMNT_0044399563 /DNA_START=1 /DNA_END=1212 /DNA_ORIENTATION=-
MRFSAVLVLCLSATATSLQLPTWQVRTQTLAKAAAEVALAASLLATPLPSLATNEKVLTVDAGGDKAAAGWPVRQAIVDLPMTTPQLSRAALDVTRPAQALVLKPADRAPTGGVVFLHGFSQEPKNYASTLRSLAATGLEVVAPTTWLLDTVFTQIETAPGLLDAPGTLQTAIIIDGLRSLQLLQEDLPAGAPLSLVGHSMGGACSLVIPSLTTTPITSVFAASPAAEASSKTELNPYLAGDANDYDDLFKNYASKPNVVVVSAKNDQIVSPSSVAEVYDAALLAASPKLKGHVALQTGSHVGFEDSLRIRIPLFGRQITLFKTLDYFLYTRDALESLLGDFDLQKATTKILLAHLNAAYSKATDLADDIPLDQPVPDWNAVSLLATPKGSALADVLGNPLQA